MAYTCPDIQGFGVIDTEYYDISADRYYARGATLPKIGNFDEVQVWVEEGCPWESPYMFYTKDGTTTYPAGWWLEEATYVNTPIQVPSSINGKNFVGLGTAAGGAFEWQPGEEEYTHPPKLTEYPYVIPSTIKYMRRLFKNQSELTGLILIDANPTYYANWLQGTTQPIKLAGASTMLDTLANGYSNVTVLIKPKISVLAQRCDSQGVLDDEGTYARVTVTIQADPVDTSYDLDILVDGVLAHAEQNITVSSAAAEAKVYIIGSGNYQTDSSYNIEVTVDDSWGVNTVTASDILTTAFFTMDVGNGGKEIAFGAPANDVLTGTDEDRGLIKCNMNALFNGDIDSPGGYNAAGAQIGSSIRIQGDGNQTLTTSYVTAALDATITQNGNAFKRTGSSIECLYDGIILVSAQACYTSGFTANDITYTQIQKNGNAVISAARYRAITSNASQTVNIGAIPIAVNAGDKLTLEVQNITGGRGTLVKGSSNLMATYIAPMLA